MGADPSLTSGTSTAHRMTPACIAGLVALAAAVPLLVVEPRWALLPLGLFIILCAVAPFWPRLGFFGPVFTRAPKRTHRIALTFDDGPYPDTTPVLLDLLARHGITATFFVVGRQIQAHPKLLQAMLAGGHEVANHSYSHDPLLMLRRTTTLADEIHRATLVLLDGGIRPLAFRPPVGIVNPRLWPLLHAQGMLCVGFSCRGPDFGNRYVQNLARRILAKVQGGDIVLLHDRPPPTPTQLELWLAELETLFLGLKARGLHPVALSQLLQRPVCVPVDHCATKSAI